jgi:hypothetical protein
MDSPLVLTGRVVTFDEDQPEIDDDAVYIGADELIAAVQARTAPAPLGFGSARLVRTGGRSTPDTGIPAAVNAAPPRRRAPRRGAVHLSGTSPAA